jgi:hypothetical protein
MLKIIETWIRMQRHSPAQKQYRYHRTQDVLVVIQGWRLQRNVLMSRFRKVLVDNQSP